MLALVPAAHALRIFIDFWGAAYARNSQNSSWHHQFSHSPDLETSQVRNNLTGQPKSRVFLASSEFHVSGPRGLDWGCMGVLGGPRRPRNPKPFFGMHFPLCTRPKAVESGKWPGLGFRGLGSSSILIPSGKKSYIPLLNPGFHIIP